MVHRLAVAAKDGTITGSVWDGKTGDACEKERYCKGENTVYTTSLFWEPRATLFAFQKSGRLVNWLEFYRCSRCG